MSYKITCYFNNENIASTDIYGANGFYEYTGYYGDTYISVGGFDGSSTFTANPESGCEFTRWVYRLGSTSGTVKYSYSNPFTYTGTQDIYIRAEGEVVEVEETRPDYFSWTYSKKSGKTFKLTAKEWNALTANINEVRAYRGYSQYSFTKAYSGDDFTAKMYNQARKAIQGISGYGTYIPTVYAGDEVTAYALNQLVSELNAIP